MDAHVMPASRKGHFRVILVGAESVSRPEARSIARKLRAIKGVTQAMARGNDLIFLHAKKVVENLSDQVNTIVRRFFRERRINTLVAARARKKKFHKKPVTALAGRSLGLPQPTLTST